MLILWSIFVSDSIGFALLDREARKKRAVEGGKSRKASSKTDWR